MKSFKTPRSNKLAIFLFQRFPEWLKLCSTRQKKPVSGTQSLGEPIEGVEDFCGEAGSGRKALLILSPDAWLLARSQMEKIRLFNCVGLTLSLVRAMNQRGYAVDVVDYHNPSMPSDHYDLVVVHGGRSAELSKKWPAETKVLLYISGLYWKEFDRESGQRYRHFEKVHQVPGKLPYRRSNPGMGADMEILIPRANACFTADLPRMISGFGRHAKKFVPTGLGSYLAAELCHNLAEKDFRTGRNNLIYVGGTGGNIQKGLDVLLEAFAIQKDAHLYIYCKVESEILKYAEHLLNLPNVHYIYHWRFGRFRKNLSCLLRQCNYTIHAPINTGAGTAFMGSVGVGLIPVGYIDMPPEVTNWISSESWMPESLAEAITSAMRQDPEWCRNAASESVKIYNKYYSPTAFEQRFGDLVDQSCPAPQTTP